MAEAETRQTEDREAAPPAEEVARTAPAERAAADDPAGPTSRRRWLIVALLCLGAAGLVTWLHFAVLLTELEGPWSVPIDDTYIHFQYARAAAEGHPFAYHAEDGYSTGCTSPLYTLVLALPYALGAKGMGLVPVSLVLGGVWLLASMLLLWRLGHALGAPGAGGAAAVLWGSWGFAWYCLFCGMETGLWVTLILAVALLYARHHRRGAATPGWALVLTAALLPVTRPEGLALLGLLLLLAGLGLLKSRPPRAWRSGPVLWPLLRWSLALLPAAAYYGANRLLTGTFSTAGMISKSLLHAPYMVPYERAVRYAEQLFETAHHFLAGEDPLFLGLLLSLPGLAAILALGLRQLARRVPGAYLLLAGWTVLTVLFASMHYIRIARWTRYYLPFFLLLIIGAGFVLLWSARALGRPWLLPAAVAALVFFQGDSTVRWVKAYAHDVRVIHEKQAGAARATRALPEDARVLVCDAGAIPYISRRWTFDIVGLTTPLKYNWFRNGVGSRFELFERLPEKKRPDHIAAYGFCLWPGAQGAISGMYHDMMVAKLGEHQAGSGEKPVRPVAKGLRLVDRMDVADLQSEAEHGYRLGHRATIQENVLRRAAVAGGAKSIADGGRLVTRDERFVFRARPGVPVTVVARYTVGLDVELRFESGGFVRRTALTRTPVDDWNEIRFEIPAKQVEAENRVKVSSLPGQSYHSYHYFFYQGTTATER